jgi:hypothetical protein
MQDGCFDHAIEYSPGAEDSDDEAATTTAIPRDPSELPEAMRDLI